MLTGSACLGYYVDDMRPAWPGIYLISMVYGSCSLLQHVEVHGGFRSSSVILRVSCLGSGSRLNSITSRNKMESGCLHLLPEAMSTNLRTSCNHLDDQLT